MLVHIDEEGRPYYEGGTLGMGSCDTISTDEVWTTNAAGQANSNTNLNLTGAGVTLAMWEKGRANLTHQEFGGRVTNITQKSVEKHANGVAAVMVGAGVANGARGMACEAELHVYSYQEDPLEKLAMVATNSSIRFSNHSYETYDPVSKTYGIYTVNDETRDEIVCAAYHHLPVWAAGNIWGGGRTYGMLTAGIAKNVLTMGAIEELPGGWTGATNEMMTSYSSWGPTDPSYGGGRIKPDLMASGWSGWIPANSINTNYNEVGLHGTSFAAPSATGALALLQELHGWLYGTTNAPWHASTWKALLIQTADEAGNAPGPDYRHGWGVMNTLTATELMLTNAWNDSFIKEFVLAVNGTSSFFVVAVPGQPLRITICWSDPPRFNGNLTNDIDLYVIAPDGTTNRSWRLTPGNPTAPATQGINTRDNVEQVVITNTVSGAYRVVVDHPRPILKSSSQWVSMVLNALPPEEIDTAAALSMTNGLPRVEISATVGSMFEILRSGNLVVGPWTDVSGSPLSMTHEQYEWTDPAGATNPVQFYQINQIE